MIVLVALRPAVSASQNASRLTPPGATTPIPVMTARRCIRIRPPRDWALPDSAAAPYPRAPVQAAAPAVKGETQCARVGYPRSSGGAARRSILAGNPLGPAVPDGRLAASPVRPRRRGGTPRSTGDSALRRIHRALAAVSRRSPRSTRRSLGLNVTRMSPPRRRLAATSSTQTFLGWIVVTAPPVLGSTWATLAAGP